MGDDRIFAVIPATWLGVALWQTRAQWLGAARSWRRRRRDRRAGWVAGAIRRDIQRAVARG